MRILITKVEYMSAAETIKARNTFDLLRGQLGVVKNELSPFGWIQYNANYQEQQAAQKKMKNEMTYSNDPPDAQEGTPLWQERFDQIMLCENLKKKLMETNKAFGEASSLVMKSHHFLAKNTHLADSFAHAITHIPESTHDQVEVLQVNLTNTKKELQETKENFYLFQKATKKKWQTMLDNIEAREERRHAEQNLSDAFSGFGYGCQHEAALALREECLNLKEVLQTFKERLANTLKEFADAREQWAEEKDELTKDRDRYKAMHEKQMRAAEQALKDLKKSQESGEDKDKQLMKLTQERLNLAAKVEDLEYQIKQLTTKLEETEEKLRQTTALLDQTTEELRKTTIEKNLKRAEEARLGAAIEALEVALVDGRAELARVRAAAAAREEELLEEMRIANEEADKRETALKEELASEIKQKEAFMEALHSSEEERKELVAELEWTKEDCERRIKETEERCAKELKDTVDALNKKWTEETAGIKKRCAILEHEVGKADSLLPHLSTLNPLPQPFSAQSGKYEPDKGSTRCLHCRKYMTFQQVWK